MVEWTFGGSSSFHGTIWIQERCFSIHSTIFKRRVEKWEQESHFKNISHFQAAFQIYFTFPPCMLNRTFSHMPFWLPAWSRCLFLVEKLYITTLTALKAESNNFLDVLRDFLYRPTIRHKLPFVFWRVIYRIDSFSFYHASNYPPIAAIISTPTLIDDHLLLDLPHWTWQATMWSTQTTLHSLNFLIVLLLPLNLFHYHSSPTSCLDSTISAYCNGGRYIIG